MLSEKPLVITIPDQQTGFILIVDDNPTNLSVLSQALKSVGWKVRVAVDGESALELAAYEPPELILLDVQMPGIGGFETCTKLKANPLTTNIPIIFMTALTDKESKVNGLSLGAVDYITKPFEQEEILARVKVHLRLRALTKSVEEKNVLLEEMTKKLGEKVMERTAALQQAQVQLIQQEKLSTLGQLLAGVAHEINNPVNFISSNITPAQEYINDIIRILQLYEKHYPQPVSEIQEEKEAINLEFVLEDLCKLLDSMKLGTERIKNISLSLRNFSRSDTATKLCSDIHDGLESTLLILRHKLKGCGHHPDIEVIKNYGNLPKVNYYPGQMNQVFMNILANAIDALIDTETLISKPKIIICTETTEVGTIIIRIKDNGQGMTEEIKQRIFEPMFTTKTVGKGTGLGLSICHQIVVEKHGGNLSCISTPGQGTEFIIEIPIS